MKHANKLGNVHTPHQRKSPINSYDSYRHNNYSVFIIVSDEEPKEINDKRSSIKLPNQSKPTQADVPILQHPDQLTVHLLSFHFNFYYVVEKCNTCKLTAINNLYLYIKVIIPFNRRILERIKSQSESLGEKRSTLLV